MKTENECDVCCNIINQSLIIECPNCQLSFCKSCQRQYAKDICMKCHMKFQKKFLLEHMGQPFINNVIKPNLINELMKEQKETLKFVQPLVEWEKKVREQKKQLRFGIRMSVPERPKISKMNGNKIFPCPIQECRGFVENGICGLCNISVCVKCHEQMNDKHMCKQEDLMSIAMLSQDSKQCPRCYTNIYRTFGCNHMYCTNCQTHFDWVSLKIMPTSTNGHYLHLQKFADNIPTYTLHDSQQPDQQISATTCDYQDFSLYHDLVNIENIDTNVIDPILVRCLWSDSNTIRMIKRQKYHKNTINQVTQDTFQDLQVKYLLNEITETSWRQSVYRQYNKKLLGFLYSDILDIYLSSVDRFQHMVSDNPTQDHNFVINQYELLVSLCNESFQNVQDEFGGPLHYIRHPNEDVTTPVIV